ncbi:MAG: helix-turn-helix domain-containing protein [Jannaschia sp.]
MFQRIEIDAQLAGDIQVPANITPYVEVLGIELAVTFLLHFGGAELYISEDPKGRSELEALVGTHNARALGQQVHLLRRRVPLAKPWIAAVLRISGASTAQIARRLHVTDVTVRRWLD